MENNLSVIAISEIKYTKELYKKMYNRVLKKERIIYLSIILILIFITLSIFSFGKFKIINFCLILILMISLIIFFRKKDIKINKKINKASLTDTKSTITFYESYLDIIKLVYLIINYLISGVDIQHAILANKYKYIFSIFMAYFLKK